MTIPTRVEVCCDPACENVNKQQVIELTADEIADREAQALAYAAEQAVKETEATAKAEAKMSAEAKLSKLGLTPEEIQALLS